MILQDFSRVLSMDLPHILFLDNVSGGAVKRYCKNAQRERRKNTIIDTMLKVRYNCPTNPQTTTNLQISTYF